MLAVLAASHLAVYHFAKGTFQPASTGAALGCAELDSLLGGVGPRLAGNASADLDAALDVCFDAQFSCSHAEVRVLSGLRRRRLTP